MYLLFYLVRDVLLNRSAAMLSPVTFPRTNPLEIPFLSSNLQNVKISTDDTRSKVQDISEWKDAFDSMDVNALETLLDLVEANEAKEIESIRSEFEPRLRPILESLRDRRK